MIDSNNSYIHLTMSSMALWRWMFFAINYSGGLSDSFRQITLRWLKLSERNIPQIPALWFWIDFANMFMKIWAMLLSGNGMCECLLSKVIRWGKLIKLHSNPFRRQRQKVSKRMTFQFFKKTSLLKTEYGTSFLGKLSKNPDCASGCFLEADDKITAFGLVRCGLHTIGNIEALETSLGLQGVLDSDCPWSFQGLDQPFKFLPLTRFRGLGL